MPDESQRRSMVAYRISFFRVAYILCNVRLKCVRLITSRAVLPSALAHQPDRYIGFQLGVISLVEEHLTMS